MIGFNKVVAPDDSACIQLQGGQVLAVRRGLVGGVAVNRTAGQLATTIK